MRVSWPSRNTQHIFIVSKVAPPLRLEISTPLLPNGDRAATYIIFSSFQSPVSYTRCLVVNNHIVKFRCTIDPWPTFFYFAHGNGEENKEGYISTSMPKGRGE